MADKKITMISTDKLIAKFQYALDNHFGYIWGEAGGTWTQAKQNAATRDMTKQYGQQWVGHRVSDCSGLFYWAFKELGGYMYHGSNTMWKKYCTEKGKLSGGKRTDGQTLKPGTAIFTGTENDHGHVGLYIGNGKVIEAQGTKVGVIMSEVNKSKWTFWGELVGVIYDATEETPAEPTIPVFTNPGAEVSGTRVALRTGPSTDASIIMRIDKGKHVDLVDTSKWVYVSYNGKQGFMMREFLNFLK